MNHEYENNVVKDANIHIAEFALMEDYKAKKRIDEEMVCGIPGHIVGAKAFKEDTEDRIAWATNTGSWTLISKYKKDGKKVVVDNSDFIQDWENDET